MSAVRAQKVEEVERIKSLVSQYPVIGIVRMEKTPARPLQRMRRELKKHGVLRMSKKSLVCRAFDELDNEKIRELKKYLDGQIALIYTKTDPFKLYRFLQENKQPAPAKPGDIAPKDIVIPAGETDIPPGPIVGQLQKIGVPAQIRRGKVVILEDTKVLKKGEKITNELAKILARLGIEPMEIGLDLQAAFSDSTIFTRDVLDTSPEVVITQLRDAYQSAINLATRIVYPTRQTIKHLLRKAYSSAQTLALECGIVTPETIKPLLAKAYLHMVSLATHLPREILGEKLFGEIAGLRMGTAEKRMETSVKEEKKEEKKKKEEEEEADAMAGLGALFG